MKHPIFNPHRIGPKQIFKFSWSLPSIWIYDLKYFISRLHACIKNNVHNLIRHVDIKSRDPDSISQNKTKHMKKKPLGLGTLFE